jgi:NADH-quinone oxidoreductase subunit L
MFLACGVAAFSAGIFHLMTHAFFKALLFLGAGSVIHAMSDEQDMRKMGGLRKYVPITYATMLLGTLAISGIPGFSGFFSKDEILWKSFSSQYGHPLLWVVGVVTAGLTAFYMFRLIYLTFHGSERMDDHTRKHLHESPRSMTVPLMALAGLSVVGGFIGMPHLFGFTNYFEEWLAPVMSGAPQHAVSQAMAAGSGDTGLEIGLMVASVLLVLFAIFMARKIYNQAPQLATKLRDKMPWVHKVLLNKYFVDEFYGAVVVRPVINVSKFLWSIFDVLVIDGLVNGLATIYGDIAQLLRTGQTGRVRTYVTLFILGVVVIVALMLFG